jgi:hypothetical protein
MDVPPALYDLKNKDQTLYETADTHPIGQRVKRNPHGGGELT